MKKPSYQGVRDVLNSHGPLTAKEIALQFPGASLRAVSSIISKMRIGVASRQIYIVRWTVYGVGRKYIRAVYALGNEPDAQKLEPISNKERLRRKREKNREMKSLTTCVWNWRP